MNTIASIILVAICISGALANPVAPKEDSVETRTIYNSGGGIYLGLNSTLVWLAVFGLGALALLLYVGASTGLLDEGSSSSYNQQRYDQFHQQQEQPYRTKRSYDESKSILICIDNRQRLMLLFDGLMLIPFSIKLEKNLYITCKLD